jgi:hypothetical protein
VQWLIKHGAYPHWKIWYVEKQFYPKPTKQEIHISPDMLIPSFKGQHFTAL